MAWCVFPFSKEGRQRLAVVLQALLIAQLVLSLIMVIFCYNVSVHVMMLLRHIHKLTVFLLYGLILLQAYCMKLHYTAGLRLMSWLLEAPHWPRAVPVSKLWMISGIFIAANGFLVQAACKSTLKALLKELSSSLRVGISQYLMEPSWKVLLDTMQIELNCCGAEKPSDWHEIPWLSVDFLELESDIVAQLAGADGKVLPPVSPYSCCTPRVLAACYHDPLQQWGGSGSWSPLASASLQARGCVEAMRAPLTRVTLALHVINALALLLQLVIVALTQLLRTSAREAALRGDCAGTGRGLLLGDLRIGDHQELITELRLTSMSVTLTDAQSFINPVKHRRDARCAGVPDRVRTLLRFPAAASCAALSARSSELPVPLVITAYKSAVYCVYEQCL